MAAQSSAWRRVLPWVLGWLAFQIAVGVTGRVAARRLDEGDEGSASIRRVLTQGGLDLHPTNPALSSVQVDLAMGGVNLDLGGLRSADGGGPSPVVDVRIRALMGGVAVHVPPDWRVWTSFRGLGGIGVAPGIQRADDEREADLRVHATVVFGGVGIETSRRM
jgi:hypothetical protein